MLPWLPYNNGEPIFIMPITITDAAAELLKRRQARRHIADYIDYTFPKYKRSLFSEIVCSTIDKFISDVQLGKRPILILQAPPQHGKSQIVSRNLPPFLLGRFPNWHVATACYSDELASNMAQDVRRFLTSSEHLKLFPAPQVKEKYVVNRIGEFTAPGGTGTYKAVGVGTGLTGLPVTIGIIDDPIKNEKEALSLVSKEGHWNWYQSVFTTRLSECSGQIIMATSWAEDDLPARIADHYRGDPRLTHLRFPAINLPDEVGYTPILPEGALVPELHSIEKLRETKSLLSDYWWSAMYQQSAKALGGNVFKETGIQYYLLKDLPKKFDKVINSWDCTFKDTDGTDFVVGQVWGKAGANTYLLAQTRGRLSFTNTCREILRLRCAWPKTREILIEDKANGPAVIDTLKGLVAGIIPIEPDGSKLARAHAVTSYWEALNVWLPHPDIAPWIREFVGELTAFPAAAHDDQVDAMTQALRRLYPLFGRLNISKRAITRALRGRVGL
jgi:predicted phage terminase large subunit-like protein